MSKPIWKQLSSGRAIDLSNPDLSAIDIWADLAMPLGALARFDGHAQVNCGTATDDTYSVAQHCVVGAEAILEETGDVTAALAFLMHDAHEAFLGDITTPAAGMIEAAMDEILARHLTAEQYSYLAKELGGKSPVAAAITGCKRTIDRELRKLCGLPETLPPHIDALVRQMDIRTLDTERRQLLGEVLTAPYDKIWPAAVLAAPSVRMRGKLTPWRRGRAAAQWYRRFEAWRIAPAKAA